MASKVGSRDWWLGRTPEQKARKAELRAGMREDFAQVGKEKEKTGERSFGDKVARAGVTLTIFVTLPFLGLAFGGIVGLMLALLLAVIIVIARR